MASWTPAPVSAIAPATEGKSMFLITLDLSGAPDLVATYTTPGQYLLTRVPLRGGPPPTFMCISSAPHSGLQFDLLVRSVLGTTSELLCKLHVGDVVELGPVKGTGFAIQNINPPEATETVLLFAAAEGIRSRIYFFCFFDGILPKLILCIFNAVRFVHLSSLVFLPLKELM